MPITPIRALPSAVRERLAKLLPMLSSTHGGERAGAAAAIERTLKAAGLDIHDLTGAITAALPAAPSPRPDDEPGSRMSSRKLAGLITTMRARRQFNERSETFLESLLARTRRQHTVSLSLKQLAWLEDLMARAGL